MRKVKIRGNHWLESSAANAWFRMVDAGMPNNVTSAGRTRSEQQKIYDRWKKGLMPGTPSVAVPGTSKHEKGNAVDVPEPTRKWLYKNGEKYGFINPAWAKRKATFEPWHFEYVGAKDTSKPKSNSVTHKVVRGDTLSAIAKRYGVTVNSIVVANGIKNPNLIKVNQVLKIPSAVHIVERGDTLSGIGKRYGVSVKRLMSMNPHIKNANIIHVGQQVRIS